jgi:hypothetical protein
MSMEAKQNLVCAPWQRVCTDGVMVTRPVAYAWFTIFFLFYNLVNGVSQN